MAQPQPLPPAAKHAKAFIHYYTSSDSCSSPGNHKVTGASPVKKVVQNKCINLPSFLSYKTWQPTRVEDYVTCSLYVFPEKDCSGIGVTGFDVSTTENKADCLDAIIGYDEAGPEGSKSVRFICEYFPPPGYHPKYNKPSKWHHKSSGEGKTTWRRRATVIAPAQEWVSSIENFNSHRLDRDHRYSLEKVWNRLIANSES